MLLQKAIIAPFCRYKFPSFIIKYSDDISCSFPDGVIHSLSPSSYKYGGGGGGGYGVFKILNNWGRGLQKCQYKWVGKAYWGVVDVKMGGGGVIHSKLILVH